MFHDLLQRACVTSHVHFKLHSFPEVKNHKTPSAEMHAGRGANVRTKRKEEGGGGNSGPSAKVCLLLCGRQEGRRWTLATTYSVPGTELGASNNTRKTHCDFPLHRPGNRPRVGKPRPEGTELGGEVRMAGGAAAGTGEPTEARCWGKKEGWGRDEEPEAQRGHHWL